MKTATPDKSLIYRDAFASGRLNEHSWSRYPELRQRALEHLVERGLGTRGLEEWVHGDASALNTGAALPLHGPAEAAAGTELARIDGSHLLVFVNGVFDPARSDVGELPIGAIVQPLSAGDAVSGLGAVADDSASSFTALNTVFWRDGLRLELAADVVLDRPVELHFLNALNGAAAVVPVRNLIRVGARSTATIIERFAPDVTGVVEQPLTEILCAPKAVVNHIKLVTGNAAGDHHGSTHVRQRSDSRYRSWEFVAGGRVARRELHLALTEPGAACDLNALYLGQGAQRFDLRTRVIHDAPECETRGALQGHPGWRSAGCLRRSDPGGARQPADQRPPDQPQSAAFR